MGAPIDAILTIHLLNNVEIVPVIMTTTHAPDLFLPYF
jgi:hypothetical protein